MVYIADLLYIVALLSDVKFLIYTLPAFTYMQTCTILLLANSTNVDHYSVTTRLIPHTNVVVFNDLVLQYTSMTMDPLN